MRDRLQLQIWWSVIVEITSTEQAADHVHGETPVSQKTGLLGTAARILRVLPGKLALPHITHALAPVHLALAQCLLDISTRQATLAQLLTNTRRAIASAGTVPDEAFEVAGFSKQPFFGKPVEFRLDQLIRSAALTQLARQLDATVLTSRKQVHGCPPNGDGGVEYGGHIGYLPRNQ